MAQGLRTFAAVVCFASLSGCAIPPRGLPAPIPTPTAQLESPIPVATRSFATISFDKSALVAQLDASTNSLLVTPVDPLTGFPLQDLAALDVGSDFDYVFYAEGDSLIFTKYSSQDPSQGELHFLTLPEWKDEFSILLLSATSTSALALSPNGTQLAVATNEARGGGLWLVDTGLHVVLAQRHGNTQISALKFSQDGQSLMSYEHPIPRAGGPSLGPPVAALRSTSDLAMEWSKPLTQVEDGFVPDVSSSGDPNQPGAGSIFHPGVVFSRAADMLYIVHADVPKLTRVDFGRRSVLTQDVHPAVAWWDQLFMLPVTDVYAKGQSGIQREARISPDGSVVYNDGVQTTLAKQADGTWLENQDPLNLEAIRLKDATRLYKSTVTGASLDLSPDGTDLLIPQMNFASGTVTGTVEVDATNGTPSAQLPGLSLRFGHLMDGTPILLSALPVSSGPTGTQMTALALDHHVLGSWIAPAYAEWLIGP